MNTAKLKLIVGGVLMAGGIGAVAWLSASQTGQYAIGVADYTSSPQRWAGRGLRVGGLSEEGSWCATGNHHTFTLIDDHDQKTTLPVVFDGTMPDTFAEGRQVIVAGKMSSDGKALIASEVIPQCASKYVPMDGAAKEFEKHHGDGSQMPEHPGAGVQAAGSGTSHAPPCTAAANADTHPHA